MSTIQVFHHSLLPYHCHYSHHISVTSVIAVSIFKCFHSEQHCPSLWVHGYSSDAFPSWISLQMFSCIQHKKQYFSVWKSFLFVRLCKICFVENILWHKLQEFSRKFDSTEFVQVLLCLTKLVFKVVLYSHKSQRNFGGLASLLAFSCTPFLCVLKLLFDEEK